MKVHIRRADHETRGGIFLPIVFNWRIIFSSSSSARSSATCNKLGCCTKKRDQWKYVLCCVASCTVRFDHHSCCDGSFTAALWCWHCSPPHSSLHPAPLQVADPDPVQAEGFQKYLKYVVSSSWHRTSGKCVGGWVLLNLPSPSPSRGFCSCLWRDYWALFPKPCAC